MHWGKGCSLKLTLQALLSVSVGEGWEVAAGAWTQRVCARHCVQIVALACVVPCVVPCVLTLWWHVWRHVWRPFTRRHQRDHPCHDTRGRDQHHFAGQLRPFPHGQWGLAYASVQRPLYVLSDARTPSGCKRNCKRAVDEHLSTQSIVIGRRESSICCTVRQTRRGPLRVSRGAFAVSLARSLATWVPLQSTRHLPRSPCALTCYCINVFHCMCMLQCACATIPLPYHAVCRRWRCCVRRERQSHIITLLPFISKFGFEGAGGPNQNTSRIQHKEVEALFNLCLFFRSAGTMRPSP